MTTHSFTTLPLTQVSYSQVHHFHAHLYRLPSIIQPWHQRSCSHSSTHPDSQPSRLLPPCVITLLPTTIQPSHLLSPIQLRTQHSSLHRYISHLQTPLRNNSRFYMHSNPTICQQPTAYLLTFPNQPATPSSHLPPSLPPHTHAHIWITFTYLVYFHPLESRMGDLMHSFPPSPTFHPSSPISPFPPPPGIDAGFSPVVVKSRGSA